MDGCQALQRDDDEQMISEELDSLSITLTPSGPGTFQPKENKSTLTRGHLLQKTPKIKHWTVDTARPGNPEKTNAKS